MSEPIPFRRKPEARVVVLGRGRRAGRRAALVRELADLLELNGGQAADFALVGAASKQLLADARAELERRRAAAEAGE